MSSKYAQLRDKYLSTTRIVPGYEQFMYGLMAIVRAGAMDTATGDKLRDYVLNFVKNNSLSNFST
ncbi:MAG: hypothetical protein IJU72_06375, partial [Bacteroidales bacterium]|nr:hypothetical protein [Bacteroidales bacterium]